jgi:ATP-dependent Clp protease protease subunit
MADDFTVLFGEETPNLDPTNYQYFNNLLNNRTIVFNKEIDETVVEHIALPLLEFEKDKSQDPITLIISTVGGSVSDGLFLCNIIDNYTKPLNIIVLGYAASMGTIILAAGAHNPNVTRKCYPFSYALLHAGFTNFGGETLSAEDAMAFNKKINDKVKQFILTHTKISEAEYTANERKQWFLDADDLYKYGFVDEIIGEGGKVETILEE